MRVHMVPIYRVGRFDENMSFINIWETYITLRKQQLALVSRGQILGNVLSYTHGESRNKLLGEESQILLSMLKSPGNRCSEEKRKKLFETATRQG